MLEVIDAGGITLSKREKAFQRYGIVLGDMATSGQDAFLLSTERGCFAVADGVGTSPYSDVAAHAVCTAYLEVVRKNDANQSNELMTIDTVRRSDTERILQYVHSAAVRAHATTTFTGMVVHPNATASYLHVGDSQLVLLRGNELIHYTSEQVKTNGYELLNYLGTEPEWEGMGYARHPLMMTISPNTFSTTKLEAEWGVICLQDGDRLALMTDGISGSSDDDKLSDEQLTRCMYRRLGASACAQLLLQESQKIDDSTIIVVDIGRT